MSASFYDLMKYAKLGIASPEMTMYDRLKASALFGGTSPDKTITGIPPLTLTAKKEGAATSYKLTGKTVQNGTPTPDAPIDILGVGDMTKNLLNLNNFAMTTTSYTNRLDSVTLETLINAFHNNEYDMTYSCEKSSTVSSGRPSGTVAFFTADNSSILVVYPNSVVPAHTDLSQTGYIYLYGNNDASEVTISKLQLELGSTATEYEPYGYKATIASNGETAATLYTDKPLYGTGDVLDEYDSTGKLTRKWGMLVLTGEETFVAATSASHYRCRTALVPKGNAQNADNVLSTHYYPNLGARDGTITLTSDGGSVCFTDDTNAVTAEAFKSYLATQYAAGTPVTIIYQLATPTEETITAPPLMLSKGTNTIDAGTEVKPSSMSITGQIK